MADADQKRVENLQGLLEDTVLVEAFDSAGVHLLRIYRGASDSPLGNLSWVAADEVTRRFSGALSEDERAVMNSCRRLMELTVLVTEWRSDRQSALDAALRVFGARINRSAAVPRNWTLESLLEKKTEPSK